MKKQEKSMYKIYINTSSRYAREVALIETTAQGSESVVGKRFGEIDIIVSIRDLLLDANLNLTDISSFDAFAGPGSFTGLKSGITVSNVLNWTICKKGLDELKVPNYGTEPNITI